MKKEVAELEIIEQTSRELSAFGLTEILYATAEFEPFSNQQKPDLKYIPKDSEYIFFVEFKSKPKNGFSMSYVNSIIEHRDFLLEGQNLALKYAFATDCKVDEELIAALRKNGIEVIMSINNSLDLSGKIINWVKNEK